MSSEILIQLQARRESAIEDSDANLAALLFRVREEVTKLREENKIMHEALEKIDWHIRGMQNDKIISMKDMVAALKVISDALAREALEKLK
jgi:hypothetical protein